jgi:hypothetical protein
MAGNQITINAHGDIELNWRNGTVTFTKTDITVNGLTLPSLSWSWLAMNLATGVVAGIGGLIFNVILSLFGGGGPNMEEILRRQLIEIERIVAAELLKVALRNAAASLDSCSRLMREYMNEPQGHFRIEDAIGKSSDVMSNLKALEYDGYKLYLSAATLHLSVLDEYSKVSGSRVNYLKAIEEFVSYHREWANRIASETDLEYQGLQAYERSSGGGMPFIPKPVKAMFGIVSGVVNLDILGTHPSGMPRYEESSPEMEALRRSVANAIYKKRAHDFPPLEGAYSQKDYMEAELTVKGWLAAENPKVNVVDWGKFRKQKEEDTINPGGLVIAQWEKARLKALEYIDPARMESIDSKLQKAGAQVDLFELFNLGTTLASVRSVRADA